MLRFRRKIGNILTGEIRTLNCWFFTFGFSAFWIPYDHKRTITACKCQISYEIFVLEMPQFQINFPDWKYTISYAHLNFSDWTWQISYEIPAWKCPIAYEHWNFPVWKYPVSYENILFESSQFHVKFPVWKYPTSNEHMNSPVKGFPDWKCKFSYEFCCVEVPNFISTFEFPWLDAPNLIWISTFGSAKFHMNILDWTAKFHFKRSNFIWNSLFGSARFHMNFPVWSSKFIRICQIPWCRGSILMWISLSGSTQF